MEEELDYISSSPLLATQKAPVKAQDEVDMPTLQRVQRALDDAIASYDSIDRLTVEQKDMTVQQQLAVSKAVKAHVSEIKLIVDVAINNVREKYATRR